MSLRTVLSKIGKDLKDVGDWIEDGLKVAVPVIGAVDPPLGALFTEIESVVEKVESATGQGVTASSLQAIVTAVATLEGLKVIPATPAPPPATPASS
jgi:hypothetical protein